MLWFTFWYRAGIETLSFQNLKTVEYKILFNNDLVDSEYAIKLIDDAGNELVESDDNKFKIETCTGYNTYCFDDGLDTGLSSEDRATTVLKPHFSFNSEAGLRVFIDRLMDNSYTGPIQNGPLVGGTDCTVTTMKKLFSCFLTEFPDATQGSYTVMVEDDAGNRNIVPDEIQKI